MGLPCPQQACCPFLPSASLRFGRDKIALLPCPSPPLQAGPLSQLHHLSRLSGSSRLSAPRLDKLEGGQHGRKILRVHLIKLIPRRLNLDQVGLALIDGGIDLNVILALALRLIVSGSCTPGRPSDRRGGRRADVGCLWQLRNLAGHQLIRRLIGRPRHFEGGCDFATGWTDETNTCPVRCGALAPTEGVLGGKALVGALITPGETRIGWGRR